jgi:hypothetical protein
VPKRSKITASGLFTWDSCIVSKESPLPEPLQITFVNAPLREIISLGRLNLEARRESYHVASASFSHNKAVPDMISDTASAKTKG